LAAQPIYIELSGDLRRLLAAKRIDLQSELKKQGIDTQLQGLSLEGRPAARDPFLIAAVSAYKHAQTKERDLHVAVDGKGEAIIDKGGNPVYNLAEKPSPLAPQDISTTRLIAGKLLTFDTTTGIAADKPAKAAAKKAVTRKSTAKGQVKRVARKRRG